MVFTVNANQFHTFTKVHLFKDDGDTTGHSCFKLFPASSGVRPFLHHKDVGDGDFLIGKHTEVALHVLMGGRVWWQTILHRVKHFEAHFLEHGFFLFERLEAFLVVLATDGTRQINVLKHIN